MSHGIAADYSAALQLVRAPVFCPSMRHPSAFLHAVYSFPVDDLLLSLLFVCTSALSLFPEDFCSAGQDSDERGGGILRLLASRSAATARGWSLSSADWRLLATVFPPFPLNTSWTVS